MSGKISCISQHFSNKPNKLVLSFGLIITVGSLASVAIAIVGGLTSIVFFTPSYSDYYLAAFALGIILSIASFKKSKVSRPPFCIEGVVEVQTDPKYIKATNDMASYLTSAKAKFSLKRIPHNKQDYVTQTLGDICKYFHINPRKAKPNDINFIFQCLAIQLIIEGQRVQATGCEAGNKYFALKENLTFQNPVPVFVKNSRGSTEAFFLDDFLGCWSQDLVSKNLKLDSFSLAAVQEKYQSTEIMDIVTQVRTKNECNEWRFIASQLHKQYWKTFCDTYEKPSFSELLSEFLETSFRNAVKDKYLTPDDIACVTGTLPVQRLAFLAFVQQCELTESGSEFVLKLPNDQIIRHNKKVKFFVDSEGAIPLEWPTSPHPLGILDHIHPTNSLTSEIFHLKKYLNNSSFLKIKEQLINETRALVAGTSVPLSSDLSKNEIETLKILNKLVSSEGDTLLLSSHVQHACEHYGRAPSRIFNNKEQYAAYFRRDYYLCPTRDAGRDIFAAGASCLVDSLSFSLLGPAKFAEARKYDDTIRIQIARSLRINPNFPLPPHTHDQSPYGISLKIGAHLKNRPNAKKFTHLVAPFGEVGAWVTLPKSFDTEYRQLVKEKENLEKTLKSNLLSLTEIGVAKKRIHDIDERIEKAKIDAIVSHALKIQRQESYAGDPELTVFAEIYKCDIALYTGEPYKRFRLHVGDTGVPTPDRIIKGAAVGSPRVVHLVLCADHFTGLSKK